MPDTYGGTTTYGGSSTYVRAGNSWSAPQKVPGVAGGLVPDHGKFRWLKYYTTADRNIAFNTEVPISFWDERHADTSADWPGMTTIGGRGGSFPLPWKGLYTIQAGVFWQSETGGARILHIEAYKNGAWKTVHDSHIYAQTQTAIASGHLHAPDPNSIGAGRVHSQTASQSIRVTGSNEHVGITVLQSRDGATTLPLIAGVGVEDEARTFITISYLGAVGD